MSAKRLLATTTLSFSTLLALTACGGAPAGSDADTPSAKTSESTEPAEPAELAVPAFPVGEPFGKAAWSVDVGKGEKTVTVRPDRVIVDRVYLKKRMLQAYTSDGKAAWTHDLSDHEYPENIPVAVLEKTVAILTEGEVEGSGLDKAKQVRKLTLLSQQDGSVVAEVEFPDGRARINSFGSVVSQVDGGLNFVTEDGKITEVKADRAGHNDGGLVGGVPFWLNWDDLHTKAGKVSGFTGIDESEIANMAVLAVANRPGLLAVRVAHGALGKSVYYVVRPETGKVAYELNCPDRSPTGSETHVARSSPSGEYAVRGSIRMSATEGQCFGGGDGQKEVELKAVDDDGTAYGQVKAKAVADDELVTIPVGGEPQVSKLPDGAPVPSGILNGGIAVHLRGATLTGNPIR